MNRNWTVVTTKCDTMWKSAAAEWIMLNNDDGEKKILPIHLACQKHSTEEALKSLIAAYPIGTKTPDRQNGQLPLHLACQTGASYDIIAVLTIKYREAVLITDKLGFLPIDYAKQHGNDEVVTFLEDAM